MTYEIVTKSSELYHHGIAGQKWGVQNGPPYPLKETVHDRIVKKAKTESGKKGADIGKEVGKVRYYISSLAITPAEVSLVASIAAVNPPAAVLTAGALAGAEYVDYKLNSWAGAWVGSKIGDAVEKSKTK